MNLAPSIYFFILILLVCKSGFAQQPSPIGIIYNPRINTYAVSGVGGGNFNELTAKKSSTSGQIAIDFNIGLQDGKTKRSSRERLKTLTTIFKFNPFLQANYISGDSLEMRKLAFVDNEFFMLGGLRYSSLREFGTEGNSKFLSSVFIDGSYTPYKLTQSSNNLNTGFSNININFGYQFGYLTNVGLGIVGFTISPQINYLCIYEDKANGTSFEELNKSNIKLSNNILGGGLKINVPFNDFSFFFETRRYFPLDNPSAINELTNRVVFSVGGVATGTFIKTKVKEDSFK